MSNCEEIECPICMDCIEGKKNCVTTECGHCFHTNCLMTSIAHNGFGCPYCRTAMAEVPDEDDDEDDEDDEDYDDDEDDEDFQDNEDVLRSFRFFMNNLNGEENDEHDIEEEASRLADIAETNEAEEPEIPLPSSEIIAQKLSQQGVTMEDLVKILMLNHNEYDSKSEQYERLDGEIFGKMRIIISNFTPVSL